MGSISVWPMVKRGLRLAYGFWKTIWIRRRMAWRSRRVHARCLALTSSGLAALGPSLLQGSVDTLQACLAI
jgi:hypothetical protein